MFVFRIAVGEDAVLIFNPTGVLRGETHDQTSFCTPQKARTNPG
jgi:hypothetical protein